MDAIIPVPWDVIVFVQRLAKLRRREIKLVPWGFVGMSTPITGLWIPTDNADYIFYAESATPTQREQIIGHELGHLLLDHTPRLMDAREDLLRVIAPSVSADLARRFLSRAGYEAR